MCVCGGGGGGGREGEQRNEEAGERVREARKTRIEGFETFNLLFVLFCFHGIEFLHLLCYLLAVTLHLVAGGTHTEPLSATLAGLPPPASPGPLCTAPVAHHAAPEPGVGTRGVCS